MTDTANAWRLETPGHEGWKRTALPDDPNKYFMVSADCHAMEPGDLWLTRLDAKYHKRLPHITEDENGQKWTVTEGHRPTRIRFTQKLEGEDGVRSGAGATLEARLNDHDSDGIDVEIMFPNRGLSMWATNDPEFADAQCRAWNDWAAETYGDSADRILPMAAIATADVDLAVAEVQRAARNGFRGVALPCKPNWGPHDARVPNYNHSSFDPLWAAIADVDLPITFHIATGQDPRAASGKGGAIVNYVVHALAPAIEPVANLCSSGVLERHPTIRFATIEAGIGWVAWAIKAMDEAYLKHHFWVQPKLQGLPSEYYRAHGFASFQEDEPGLRDAVEFDLVDNFMWANDYPHHEGTWPHSAQAIERTMGHLDESQR
ncbi:MAG: amidohydrolase family protein, partial [Gammaproteobacteria bacterium]|nr:amidohydrolase family protein [Gammaproteobacteria bacterium]